MDSKLPQIMDLKQAANVDSGTSSGVPQSGTEINKRINPCLSKRSILSRHDSFCSTHSFDPIGVARIYERASLAVGESPQRFHEDRADRLNNSFHYVRYIVISVGGLAVGFMSLLRLNITVAILNMVNQTQVYLTDKPDADLVEYFGEGYEEVGEFEWDNEIQQLIISYYMIAYTLPQLLTTKLALRIGARKSIAISVALCALSCLLTPVLAYHGWQYVVILRLVNGLGASAILPVMVNVIELWMPDYESSLGLAIVQSCQSILFTLSPVISASLSAIHWKWAFYAPALAALVFCVIWLLLVSDKPADCWLISQKELDVICGCSDDLKSDVELEKEGEPVPPVEGKQTVVSWTKALRLRSFYALVAVWIFYQSSFGSFSFLIPSYMRQVLKVPIIENGMACFIMQCGCMFSVIWPQPILKIVREKLGYSLTASRRLVQTLICLVAFSTLSLVAMYHEYQVPLFAVNRIFHLSTDTIVTSTIMSQYSKTGVSSVIFSIINSIGNFSTVFFCMIVGKFLDLSGQSRECWSWVFVAMGAMNIVIMILFLTVISSDPIDLEKVGQETKADNIEEGKHNTKRLDRS